MNDNQMNDNEAARLLLNFALRNGVMIQDNDAPPAQILHHVPAHGEAVVDREDEDHRRRGLLLSSLGPIAAMMGAGFIFIQQLFEEKGYKVDTLFSRPKFGEFIVKLTPQQKQVFCANTAYYIDAMRHNKQLEVIKVGDVQKFKPLSQSVSTDVVTMTPSSIMRLHGNEVIENVGDKIVYKQGETEVVVPEDPIEISAFCMAHFFNTENVQILMNWGEDFKLVSEADLLRLLGEMRDGNDWKQRIVGNIFNSVYSVYNQTGPYLDSITRAGASISDAIQSAPANIHLEWEVATEVTLPRYREQFLNNLARNHPQIWAAANTVRDYPIPSTILALIVLYYLRTPIRAVATIVNETVRLPFRILSWFTGQNPDRAAANEHLAIANAEPPGGVRRGGGNQQPLSVIVINNPLPLVYIAELEKIFDKAGSIESFVTHINMNTVPLPKTKLQKLKKFARKAAQQHSSKKQQSSKAAKSIKAAKSSKATKSIRTNFKKGFRRLTSKKESNLYSRQGITRNGITRNGITRRQKIKKKKTTK